MDELYILDRLDKLEKSNDTLRKQVIFLEDQIKLLKGEEVKE